MGLIQAVVGSIGGMLADQWKDFYTVPSGLPPTAALFAAVPQGTNAGRGSNTKGSQHHQQRLEDRRARRLRLLLFQDGAITASSPSRAATSGAPTTSTPSRSSPATAW
jgi:hypothetical protein